MEIIVMMILVVLTSAVILFLIQSGIITVKADAEDVQLLNANFIPYTREGSLLVKEFQFCSFVDESYLCLSPQDSFPSGEAVHFRFVVESSTYQGEIMLVENYRLKGPDGKVLLDVEEEANFYYEMKSKENMESIKFKDYFFMADYLAKGEYTLELIIENPYLNKKVNMVKRFRLA